jgi:hypothetical protein
LTFCVTRRGRPHGRVFRAGLGVTPDVAVLGTPVCVIKG